MFTQGEILKSKERSEDFPKFVMVLFDKKPSKAQFNAVVIFCKSAFDELSEDEEAGYVSNDWNTPNWEKYSWTEAMQWILESHTETLSNFVNFIKLHNEITDTINEYDIEGFLKTKAINRN